MSKPRPVDILVLGNHPASYLAAALLAHKSSLKIIHAVIPGVQHVDRLVQIHPDLFSLHPLLEPLRKKVKVKGIFGARFLSDDLTGSEHRTKSAMCGVGSLKDVRAVMEKLAASQKVAFMSPKEIRVQRIDESGVDVLLDEQVVHPTALVLADPLPADQQRILGLPEEWETGVMRSYSCLKVKLGKLLNLSARPLAPMSLNLKGLHTWAWLLPGVGAAQFCVEQPPETRVSHPPADLLREWVEILLRHGILKGPVHVDENAIISVDIPAAGALAHEGVANRTLLVGPAGGFYASTTEDVYPNCWSTIFAAEVLKKAIRQTHLQDAIQPFRHVWRTTLGNYLRGPQQNLRFLLPLIYRNPLMTTRMVEGILVGRKGMKG